MSNYAELPIGKIVADNLAAAEVFEQYGLDFCCHGHFTLQESCQKHDLDLQALVKQLQELPQSGTAEHAPDYGTWPLDKLCRHIVETHHAFTKDILPKSSRHFDMVLRAHGATHPELEGLHKQFKTLRQELEAHLQKEELVLFPFIEAMQQARRQNLRRPESCFTVLSQPLDQMIDEHEEAGAILDSMHAKTEGFKAPADACNTYRLLFKELSDLEKDLHRHIALENHMLFPKATDMEKSMPRN
ncbi:MAG: iron-sulfur cluster repair di-iron protein [Lentisphaerae bacterium]|mgnify:CR=1 FL=1|nr:iron-sulfur cluster repair di-iron protein [Lentisphaerota bacterium]